MPRWIERHCFIDLRAGETVEQAIASSGITMAGWNHGGAVDVEEARQRTAVVARTVDVQLDLVVVAARHRQRLRDDAVDRRQLGEDGAEDGLEPGLGGGAELEQRLARRRRRDRRRLPEAVHAERRQRRDQAGIGPRVRGQRSGRVAQTAGQVDVTQWCSPRSGRRDRLPGRA